VEGADAEGVGNGGSAAVVANLSAEGLTTVEGAGAGVATGAATVESTATGAARCRDS
jgi:hypothetical protein